MAWYKTVSRILDRFGLSRRIHDKDTGDLYLERFYLFSTRWIPVKCLQYKIVLHHFWRGDQEDALHDHPWSWGSKLLEGSYEEETHEGFQTITPESGWRWNSADYAHRILLEQDKPVWSIFIMGPKTHDWGFIDRAGKWTRWDTYLNIVNKS